MEGLILWYSLTNSCSQSHSIEEFLIETNPSYPRPLNVNKCQHEPLNLNNSFQFWEGLHSSSTELPARQLDVPAWQARFVILKHMLCMIYTLHIWFVPVGNWLQYCKLIYSFSSPLLKVHRSASSLAGTFLDWSNASLQTGLGKV